MFKGYYEVCVTARVNYGQLRVNVEMFGHNEEELQQKVSEKVELESTRRAIFVSFFMDNQNLICRSQLIKSVRRSINFTMT